jgi:hypothetical protein
MNILLANQSTAISDSEVQAIMQVLQVQAWRDFCPAYGIEVPTLRFDAPGSLRDGEWLLSFFDTSDEAGALGYHDLSPAGTPLGKVFAKTDLMYGSLVSVTASHELLEMLADPHIDKDVPGTLNHRRRGSRCAGVCHQWPAGIRLRAAALVQAGEAQEGDTVLLHGPRP